MNNLYQISESTNLDLVELTTGRNGYPSNISKALDASSLESFSEVQEIAEKYNLEIVKIHQKNGWHFWQDQGWMNEPFKLSAEDFGDNYSEFSKMDESDFFKNEIHPMIEDIEDFESLEKFLESKKEIWDEIEEMEDDEMVLTHEGYYSETIKQECLYYQHDTNHYKIALAQK